MPAPMGSGPNHRQFLQRATLLAAGSPALVAFLDACSNGGQSKPAPSLKIASPENPVKWDISRYNKPIVDGLAPEKGVTLQVYSYVEYVGPDAIKSSKVDSRRQRRLRHLLPELRPWQPAGHRTPDPPDKSQLHPQHQECLAVLQQPLV